MLRLAGIMPKSLVQHLRDYMTAHQLSQSELAKRVPMAESGLSNIMSGKTKRPRPDMLRQIAHATGLSYLEINAMLDPLLSEELSRFSGATSPSDVSKSALSPKARLVAEEFDKLPSGTQDLFLGLVLNYHSGSSSAQK